MTEDDVEVILPPPTVGYWVKYIEERPSFQATGRRFLLIFLGLPSVQLVRDHYMRELARYRPKVRVMRGNPNEDIPFCHTRVLIDLQKKLDTPNATFFDMNSRHPWVYEIDRNIIDAWYNAIQYVSKDGERYIDAGSSTASRQVRSQSSSSSKTKPGSTAKRPKKAERDMGIEERVREAMEKIGSTSLFCFRSSFYEDTLRNERLSGWSDFEPFQIVEIPQWVHEGKMAPHSGSSSSPICC